MYVHENDRHEYVHAHDDDCVHVVHACAHESECVHVCVLRAYVNEHVHVHDDDDVRARGDVHGHARGRDDDQSHQQCHGLFTMFHMHIEVCSPNTAFRDAVYMKMITVERNRLKGFFNDACGRLLNRVEEHLAYHRSAQKMVLNIMCSCESSSNVVNHAC